MLKVPPQDDSPHNVDDMLFMWVYFFCVSKLTSKVAGAQSLTNETNFLAGATNNGDPVQ